MCDFCLDFEQWLEVNANSKFDNKYKAKLEIETYRNNQLCSSITTKGRKLNYCPTCGKKLKAEHNRK